MASVIEDAETYQHSSISPFESNSDTVPLTNPTSDASNIRSTSMGNITQGISLHDNSASYLDWLGLFFQEQALLEQFSFWLMLHLERVSLTFQKLLMKLVE